MRRSARWTLFAMVGLVVGGVGLAAPAAAHVTVQADDAAPGSRARVVFRVPNEGETATTKLEVHLRPEGAPPIPSALTAPVAGWSSEIEYAPLDEPIEGPHGATIDEAVSVITWTADRESDGIHPGEYGEFPVIMGPLPEADELFFPTFQTYAGVDEPVEWIERPDPDGEEPSRPAPVLRLTASGDESGSDSGSESGSESGDTSAVASGDAEAGAEADSGADDTLARVAVGVAIAGLVAALGGLALGFVAFRRTRQ